MSQGDDQPDLGAPLEGEGPKLRVELEAMHRLGEQLSTMLSPPALNAAAEFHEALTQQLGQAAAKLPMGMFTSIPLPRMHVELPRWVEELQVNMGAELAAIVAKPYRDLGEAVKGLQALPLPDGFRASDVAKLRIAARHALTEVDTATRERFEPALEQVQAVEHEADSDDGRTTDSLVLVVGVLTLIVTFLGNQEAVLRNAQENGALLGDAGAAAIDLAQRVLDYVTAVLGYLLAAGS